MGSTSLIELNVSGTGVTDLAALGGHRMLGRLTANNTLIKDTDIAPIAQLRNLYKLDIHGVSVSPEVIAKLQSERPDCEIDYFPKERKHMDGWIGGVMALPGDLRNGPNVTAERFENN